jgi:hypothetical protein
MVGLRGCLREERSKVAGVDKGSVAVPTGRDGASGHSYHQVFGNAWCRF